MTSGSTRNPTLVLLGEAEIARITKTMRQVAYFGAFVSFVIVCRWIKIDRDHIPLVDVASEDNIWTWLNVVYMVIAANALFLAGYLRRQRGAPAAGWFLAGAAVLLLSLDDMISIHERFEPIGVLMGGGSGLFHFSWVIPGIGAAIICGMVFWSAMRTADGAVRRSFLLGGAFFFGGALGLEMISGAVLDQYGHRRPYTILYHIEEIFEAVGMVFIFGAGLRDVAMRFQITPTTVA